VTKENHAVNNTTLEIIEGYVNACLGRAEDIPAWLRTGDMSPARFIYQGHAFNYIVYGKAVLLSKNYIKLEMLTEELKQYFSAFHYQLGFLHKQILEAAAKYRLYGLDAGCSLLRRAFDEAREDHIILPFAEYAPDIIDLVRQLVASSPGDEYIKKVLLSCEKYMDSLKNIPENSASLSARELQVLALAAEGLKRGEIAQRLHIMPGTVKVHMEHVYRKLEAGGKLDAVNKARKLKLI
jgi:LuxR family maltose regulon positive regulatory protein